MSIENRLSLLNQQRLDLVSAVNTKGGTLTSDDMFPEIITGVQNIETGGGGCGEFKVTTYDYDGITVLKEEAVNSGQNATPAEDPMHPFLELRGFHGSYENVTEDREVYALYRTSGDATVLFFRLSLAVTYMTINITSYHADGFTYSWDGEAASTMIGTGNKQINRNLTPGVSHYLVIGNVSSNTSIKLGRPYSYVCLIPLSQANKNTLEKVYLGNSCGIEDYVFYYCFMLNTIVFNETINILPDTALYNCYSLKAAVIPNITTLTGTFESCNSLEKVIGGDVTVDASGSLFRYCASLKNIGINILNVGGYDVRGCISLKSFKYPSAYTSTGVGLLQGLNIEECFMHEGILTINQNTFRDCSFLKYIDIPSTVTNIDFYGIHNCMALRYVIFRPIVPPTVGDNVFSNSYYNPNMDIYVPDESLAAYKAVANLSNISNLMKPLSTFNPADYE